MSATEAPFDFGQTELTKYEKRHFEFLRVSEASGLKVKITGIRCVAARAVELNSPRLQWTVLNTKLRAKKFYKEAGGTTDAVCLAIFASLFSLHWNQTATRCIV